VLGERLHLLSRRVEHEPRGLLRVDGGADLWQHLVHLDELLVRARLVSRHHIVELGGDGRVVGEVVHVVANLVVDREEAEGNVVLHGEDVRDVVLHKAADERERGEVLQPGLGRAHMTREILPCKPRAGLLVLHAPVDRADELLSGDGREGALVLQVPDGRLESHMETVAHLRDEGVARLAVACLGLLGELHHVREPLAGVRDPGGLAPGRGGSVREPRTGRDG